MLFALDEVLICNYQIPYTSVFTDKSVVRNSYQNPVHQSDTDPQSWAMVATINIRVTTQAFPLARKYEAYTAPETEPVERISASSRPPSGGAVAETLSTELTWRLQWFTNVIRW